VLELTEAQSEGLVGHKSKCIKPTQLKPTPKLTKIALFIDSNCGRIPGLPYQAVQDDGR
jgi:hypothetical protein